MRELSKLPLYTLPAQMTEASALSIPLVSLHIKISLRLPDRHVQERDWNLNPAFKTTQVLFVYRESSFIELTENIPKMHPAVERSSSNRSASVTADFKNVQQSALHSKAEQEVLRILDGVRFFNDVKTFGSLVTEDESTRKGRFGTRYPAAAAVFFWEELLEVIQLFESGKTWSALL